MEASGALLIFGLCGLVSVLVDIDHGLAIWLWRYVSPRFTHGRLWHTPVFLISGLIFFSLVAHLGGLYHRYLLIAATVLIMTGTVLVFSPHARWKKWK